MIAVTRQSVLIAAFASAALVFAALAFLRPVEAQLDATLPGAIGRLLHAEGGYAGSQACAGCHQAEFHAWARSDHAFAMAEATERTVRGDFSDVTVEQAGSKGRFFKRDGQFIVATENRDGQMQDFIVSASFGIAPLQQYLVRFPDGRLQVLPWAWDTRPQAEGGQRWFMVYGEEPIPPADTRHWTRGQQNWNYMCAECHSTHVEKRYDAASNRFATRFSEISVGCEACHGPAASHIVWAEKGRPPSVSLKGFAHRATERPAIAWSIDPQTGSPPHGVSRPLGDEVETCARCHARRAQLSEDWKPGAPLEDTHLPSFLADGLFEADGMMRDEVFNDHSFKQSLMYQKGVVCSDCHDPHSARLRAPGAQICGQCHEAEKFASPQHTGHQAAGGPDCIACHMPSRTYMVVDRRHDHSFRIPRPDLAATTGAPNACNDCHRDQSSAWAADAIARWHGPVRRGFQNWGEAFALARKGDPAARNALLAIIADPTRPALVRATALDETARFATRDTARVAASHLADPAPIVRLAAIRATAVFPADERARLIAPRLNDPVRAVRIEAASALAALPRATIPMGDWLAFEKARDEQIASLILNQDRPEARAGLAQARMQQGDVKGAETELREALQLMPDAAILAVNLADLYRVLGREADANAVLVEFLARAPDAVAVRHALGLSLIRQKNYADALSALQRAYEEEPTNARYAYVYSVALQSSGKRDEGRLILEKALVQNIWNVDLNNALLADALSSNDTGRAAIHAKRLSTLRPDDPSLARLSDVLNR